MLKKPATGKVNLVLPNPVCSEFPLMYVKDLPILFIYSIVYAKG